MIPRRIALALPAAALYGFSIGSLHSFELASWNLIKFPLLIVLTALLCAASYHVSARFVTDRLSLRAMARLAVSTYADVSVLLVSLAPVSLFLALTVEQPDRDDLNEYPLFLGLNVLFIALAGSTSLVLRGLQLHRRHALPTRQTFALLGAWLALSLFAGGQVCWYFRPYFGVSTIPLTDFALGTQPDHHGATNFYEAVYHIVDPPQDVDANGTRPEPRLDR